MRNELTREERKQALEIESRLLFARKEYSECLIKLDEMQSILDKKDIIQWKYSCLEKGRCFRHLGDIVKAEYWANEALKHIYDNESRKSVLFEFALIYKIKGDYPESDQCFFELEEDYIHESLFKEAGKIRFNRGNIQVILKNYEQAKIHYSLSEKLYNMELEKESEKDEEIKKNTDRLLNHLYEHWAKLNITEIIERNELNDISRSQTIDIIHKITDSKMKKELFEELMKGGE